MILEFCRRSKNKELLFVSLMIVLGHIRDYFGIKVTSKIIPEPWYNKTINGYPRQCILHKETFSEIRQFPIYAEVLSQTMARFPFRKISLNQSLFNQTSTYYILENVIVNQYGATIWRNNWINYPYETHYRMSHGIIVKEFKEAIYLSNNYMKMYAHIFLDLFAPFILLPEEVKRKYPLVTGAKLRLVAEIYTTLGYNAKNLYQFPSANDFVMIHKMHTVYGFNQVNGHIGISLQNLREKLKGPLNLDLVPPNRYILFNRKRTEMRYLINFDELCSDVKNKYKYPWEIVTDIPKGLNNTAKAWNSVKLVFGATGSTFANAIFMQNASVACIHLANWYDIPAMQTCLSYGVKIFVSDTNTCKHFSHGTCKALISSSLASIGRALAYLNQQANNETTYSRVIASPYNYSIITADNITTV